MKQKKNNVSRSLIFALVFGLLAWGVWSKIRIWISITLTPWQALLFFGTAVVVLFLIIDHFINRER